MTWTPHTHGQTLLTRRRVPSAGKTKRALRTTAKTAKTRGRPAARWLYDWERPDEGRRGSKGAGRQARSRAEVRGASIGAAKKPTNLDSSVQYALLLGLAERTIDDGRWFSCRLRAWRTGASSAIRHDSASGSPTTGVEYQVGVRVRIFKNNGFWARSKCLRCDGSAQRLRLLGDRLPAARASGPVG